MKKFNFPLSLILSLIVITFYSCSTDNPEPSPELILSTEQLSISSNGETKFFNIKSNTSWESSSSQNWVTLSPPTGIAGTTKVDVTLGKNETSAPRTATVTVTAGSLTKQITIAQSGSTILIVSSNEFTLDSKAQEIIIAVTSSGQYSVTTEQDWIEKLEGTDKFKIGVNHVLFNRSGTIEFKLDDVTQVVTIIQSGNPLRIPADMNGMNSDAMAISGKMIGGWNLGNSLEATGVNNGVVTANETLWGNAKTTKTLIDAVKAAGFNTVRIPCAWSGYIEDPVTYKIKESWLARVKEVVDYCVENEMYAIVNIHWDGGWLEEHPLYSHQSEVNTKQKALWEQIAVYFRDYDEHLLFAGTNEVHANYGNPTSEHLEVQHTYNQTFVDAVRSTGGRNSWRTLVIQAFNTNISHAVNYLTLPDDTPGTTNRMMAEVHFYDPYDFTLDATSSKYLWGAAYAGNEHTSNFGQEAWVDEAFESMKTKFINNGIPVILGEYAASLRSSLATGLADHIASRNHYLNYVTKSAKDHGMIPVYWDAGFTGNNGSGLFDRATGDVVHADALEAIVSAFE
jgi:endoglucanase